MRTHTDVQHLHANMYVQKQKKLQKKGTHVLFLSLSHANTRTHTHARTHPYAQKHVRAAVVCEALRAPIVRRADFYLCSLPELSWWEPVLLTSF